LTEIKRIIISRTDNLGDVMLTLPMAGILKTEFPGCKIIFLGKKYTKAIAGCSAYIDEFVDFEELFQKTIKQQINILQKLKADIIIHVFPNKQLAKLAKKAKIATRIGTSHRYFHWWLCNFRINLGRKNSTLHEAQLNLQLLKPLEIKVNYSLKEIAGFYGFNNIEKLDEKWQKLIDRSKFNLILHPKSKGSAREWGLDNFNELVHQLPQEKYKIFITGTTGEGLLLNEFLINNKDLVSDLTGKLTLSQLIAFINAADGLVAASTGRTGPLHIAAALGKKAIGIYPPIKPMHPGRWAPIGKNAGYLVLDKKCNDCRKNLNCTCIRNITPAEVIKKLS